MAAVGYTAFGHQRYQNNSSAFSVTRRYTGQQIDEDTGLYFYGSRYYDPQIGRFIQADTIVPSANTSQALNRYSYVNNNPLILIDPTGHYYDSPANLNYINTPAWNLTNYNNSMMLTDATLNSLIWPDLSSIIGYSGPPNCFNSTFNFGLAQYLIWALLRAAQADYSLETHII